MSTDSNVITVAKPHTIKKFELIERYVDEWARKILGNAQSKGIVFIDCMSNSGYYYDVDGNLIEGTAVRVAKRLNTIIENYPRKQAWLYFNDIDPRRVNYLQKSLAELKLSNVTIEYSISDCDAFLKDYDLSKHRYVNTLMIYDPYDAHIDWAAVTPFMKTWGEVILNHMVQDTARGATVATRTVTIGKYQNTYQKTLEEILAFNGDRQKLDAAIVALIKDQIADSKRDHYIASFPFFNRNNGQVYNLIFCSSNVAGIKLFKKAAWKTFGNKSSLKDTHGEEQQLALDLDGTGECTVVSDEGCYYVQDIAKYIHDRFYTVDKIRLQEVYDVLDKHPIFPTDGYKQEIKKCLAELYHAKIIGKGENAEIVFQHYSNGIIKD